MPRKAHGRGEGSIGCQEGRWFAYISLGYGPDGKRIRKRVYADSKNDAQKELRRLQNEHDAGRLVETEAITVGEYLERWLNNTAKNNVGPQTFVRYSQLVNLYLVPILGGVKLYETFPLHVEQCYATMAKGFGERKPAGAFDAEVCGCDPIDRAPSRGQNQSDRAQRGSGREPKQSQLNVR